jgi:hypothetical protein
MLNCNVWPGCFPFLFTLSGETKENNELRAAQMLLLFYRAGLNTEHLYGVLHEPRSSPPPPLPLPPLPHLLVTFQRPWSVHACTVFSAGVVGRPIGPRQSQSGPTVYWGQLEAVRSTVGPYVPARQWALAAGSSRT